MLPGVLVADGRQHGGLDRDGDVADGNRGLVSGRVLVEVVFAIDVCDGSAALGR